MCGAAGTRQLDVRACNTCPMPKSLFQSFLSVFTQMSPVLEMFGWKIFVRKKPLGGAVG